MLQFIEYNDFEYVARFWLSLRQHINILACAK